MPRPALLLVCLATAGGVQPAEAAETIAVMWAGILQSAFLGDAEAVLAWLDGGGRVNEGFSGGERDGVTLLMGAAVNGHERVVDILLQRGADANLKNSRGGTALMHAAIEGHERVVELLLQRGAEINVQDSRGVTALMGAALNGHERVVELLLQRGADMQTISGEGKTAMTLANEKGHSGCVAAFKRHLEVASGESTVQVNEQIALAIAGGDVDTVMAWLDDGGHVNATFPSDSYVKDIALLMIAASNGDEQMIDLLLERGAGINQRDSEGGTALMYAAQKGRERATDVLLQRGAEIALQDDIDGSTALTHAARAGHAQVADILLRHGAEVDQQRRPPPSSKHASNGTALLAAAGAGHDQTVETLLRHGAEIDHQDSSGGAALMIAAINGMLTTVNLLLQHGAQANLLDMNNQSALLQATMKGHERVVDSLIRHGAGVDLQEITDGFTPLMIAAGLNYHTIVRKLLRAGADTTARGAKSGKTAQQMAERRGHKESLQAFEEHRMEWSVMDRLLSHGGALVVIYALNILRRLSQGRRRSQRRQRTEERVVALLSSDMRLLQAMLADATGCLLSACELLKQHFVTLLAAALMSLFCTMVEGKVITVVEAGILASCLHVPLAIVILFCNYFMLIVRKLPIGKPMWPPSASTLACVFFFWASFIHMTLWATARLRRGARAAEPARGQQRGRSRRRGRDAAAPAPALEADADAEAARERARFEERAKQEQREAEKAAKDARRREANEANRQMAKAREAAENPPAPVELGADEVCELSRSRSLAAPPHPPWPARLCRCSARSRRR